MPDLDPMFRRYVALALALGVLAALERLRPEGEVFSTYDVTSVARYIETGEV